MPQRAATDDAAAAEATEPLTLDEKLELAVDGLVAADSYAFEVTVEITTQGTVVVTELEGWVQDRDRELVLRADGNEVITRVIDGVATVERDGDTVEVTLEEAPGAPSLDILKALRDLSESGGEITGRLNAGALKDVGFDVKGSADVTVTLTPEGSLEGYTLAANNGGWTIGARIFDVGESFG